MLSNRDIFSARCVVEDIDTGASPGDILPALAAQPEPVMLDSAAVHETYGRYSVLACRPVEVLTLSNGILTNRAGDVLASDDAGIWRALAEAFARVALRSAPQPAPAYLPGWIWYVGYEVGRHVEKLPGRAPRDTHLPDLRLAFYDAILLYDAMEKTWRLVRVEFDSPPPGAGVARDALRRIVLSPARVAPASRKENTDYTDFGGLHGGQKRERESSPGVGVPKDDTPDRAISPSPDSGRSRGLPEADFTPEEYRRAVARCVEYIAAGDIFQVNLSQRFRIRRCPPPLDIYRELRRGNPASYAAYMTVRAGGRDLAVLSSSPELFLRVRGGRVVTRPIKGTRPRTGDARKDEPAADDLWKSPKDNAELAMIIDLLRNDLGRACRYGSVRVAEPKRLETHPTVFHLVGTVEGVLRDGVGPAELLRATFPGGSITGAPKIRAMEIIDELEPCARGVYTGCIGIVCADGSCEWNIAIRTILVEDDTAFVQAGGGIVADSTPRGEYDETLDKARAMLEAVRQAGRSVR